MTRRTLLLRDKFELFHAVEEASEVEVGNEIENLGGVVKEDLVTAIRDLGQGPERG